MAFGIHRPKSQKSTKTSDVSSTSKALRQDGIIKKQGNLSIMAGHINALFRLVATSLMK